MTYYYQRQGKDNCRITKQSQPKRMHTLVRDKMTGELVENVGLKSLVNPVKVFMARPD
jgi:hypothetical protein